MTRLPKYGRDVSICVAIAALAFTVSYIAPPNPDGSFGVTVAEAKGKGKKLRGKGQGQERAAKPEHTGGHHTSKSDHHRGNAVPRGQYVGEPSYQPSSNFCPPGLRYKNDYCMPPGQYKKLRRGDRISDFRRFAPLDYRKFGLREPGPGRRYIRIGGDAYLIAEGTQRVIEAINLFSAAGN